ncbi:MAG: TrkA family potassium uptake protein [Bacteroidales bacterium]|nr:TrkA family potassium uptake protein [Bacteroidales bacterium]
MKFVVIGLGNFGSVLCESLSSMRHDVVGVDSDMEKVEAFKKTIDNVVCLDACNSVALNTLPLKDADAVIVTIGENFGASVKVIALLKQMGVKRLIGRSMSSLHRTVIEAIGVDEIISPEEEYAQTFALKMNLPGTVQSFPVGKTSCMIELKAPSVLVGQTLSSIDFRGRFGLQLVAISRKTTEKNVFGKAYEASTILDDLHPDERIQADDNLFLFGRTDAVYKLAVL